jgi:hypothetical protein
VSSIRLAVEYIEGLLFQFLLGFLILVVCYYLLPALVRPNRKSDRMSRANKYDSVTGSVGSRKDSIPVYLHEIVARPYGNILS